jgi:hypothetical protein
MAIKLPAAMLLPMSQASFHFRETGGDPELVDFLHLAGKKF